MSHPRPLTLPPPKNLNKNRQSETPPKRPAPARRFLLSVVSSLLLGGLVLGWPGTGGAQTSYTCTRAGSTVSSTTALHTDCNTPAESQGDAARDLGYGRYRSPELV